LPSYLQLAARIRRSGLGVEVYPEPKKLGQQLKYADKRGFAVAIIAGEQEFAAGTVQVKNLKTTEAVTVSLANANELESALQKLLAAK
jgi:histidyl-tRNA synthetase